VEPSKIELTFPPGFDEWDTQQQIDCLALAMRKLQLKRDAVFYRAGKEEPPGIK
jgi:hypothetical protein